MSPKCRPNSRSWIEEASIFRESLNGNHDHAGLLKRRPDNYPLRLSRKIEASSIQDLELGIALITWNNFRSKDLFRYARESNSSS
jgi:hypothetical protein